MHGQEKLDQEERAKVLAEANIIHWLRFFQSELWGARNNIFSTCSCGQKKLQEDRLQAEAVALTCGPP